MGTHAAELPNGALPAPIIRTPKHSQGGATPAAQSARKTVEEKGWHVVSSKGEGRSWNKLYHQLYRVVDDLYQCCELEGHSERVNAVLSLLKDASQDFNDLAIQLVALSKPKPHTPIAWQVKAHRFANRSPRAALALMYDDDDDEPDDAIIGRSDSAETDQGYKNKSSMQYNSEEDRRINHSQGLRADADAVSTAGQLQLPGTGQKRQSESPQAPDCFRAVQSQHANAHSTSTLHLRVQAPPKGAATNQLRSSAGGSSGTGAPGALCRQPSSSSSSCTGSVGSREHAVLQHIAATPTVTTVTAASTPASTNASIGSRVLSLSSAPAVNGARTEVPHSAGGCSPGAGLLIQANSWRRALTEGGSNDAAKAASTPSSQQFSTPAVSKSVSVGGSIPPQQQQIQMAPVQAVHRATAPPCVQAPAASASTSTPGLPPYFVITSANSRGVAAIPPASLQRAVSVPHPGQPRTKGNWVSIVSASPDTANQPPMKEPSSAGSSSGKQGKQSRCDARPLPLGMVLASLPGNSHHGLRGLHAKHQRCAPLSTNRPASHNQKHQGDLSTVHTPRSSATNVKRAAAAAGSSADSTGGDTAAGTTDAARAAGSSSKDASAIATPLGNAADTTECNINDLQQQQQQHVGAEMLQEDAGQQVMSEPQGGTVTPVCLTCPSSPSATLYTTPSRRRTPMETKVVSEEKQARAERARLAADDARRAKLARVQESRQPRQEARKLQEERVEAIMNRCAEKDARSKQLRDAHIAAVVHRAGTEARKVAEVAWINQLTEEDKKLSLQQKLEDGDARRRERLEERLARVQEAAREVEAAAERRRAAEDARQSELAEKARRKEAAQAAWAARLDEERKAQAAAREAAKEAQQQLADELALAAQQQAAARKLRIEARLKEAAGRRAAHFETIRERAALGASSGVGVGGMLTSSNTTAAAGDAAVADSSVAVRDRSATPEPSLVPTQQNTGPAAEPRDGEQSIMFGTFQVPALGTSAALPQTADNCQASGSLSGRPRHRRAGSTAMAGLLASPGSAVQLQTLQGEGRVGVGGVLQGEGRAVVELGSGREGAGPAATGAGSSRNRLKGLRRRAAKLLGRLATDSFPLELPHAQQQLLQSPQGQQLLQRWSSLISACRLGSTGGCPPDTVQHQQYTTSCSMATQQVPNIVLAPPDEVVVKSVEPGLTPAERQTVTDGQPQAGTPTNTMAGGYEAVQQEAAGGITSCDLGESTLSSCEPRDASSNHQGQEQQSRANGNRSRNETEGEQGERFLQQHTPAPATDHTTQPADPVQSVLTALPSLRQVSTIAEVQLPVIGSRSSGGGSRTSLSPSLHVVVAACTADLAQPALKPYCLAAAHPSGLLQYLMQQVGDKCGARLPVWDAAPAAAALLANLLQVQYNGHAVLAAGCAPSLVRGAMKSLDRVNGTDSSFESGSNCQAAELACLASVLRVLTLLSLPVVECSLPGSGQCFDSSVPGEQIECVHSVDHPGLHEPQVSNIQNSAQCDCLEEQQQLQQACLVPTHQQQDAQVLQAQQQHSRLVQMREHTVGYIVSAGVVHRLSELFNLSDQPMLWGAEEGTAAATQEEPRSNAVSSGVAERAVGKASENAPKSAEGRAAESGVQAAAETIGTQAAAIGNVLTALPRIPSYVVQGLHLLEALTERPKPVAARIAHAAAGCGEPLLQATRQWHPLGDTAASLSIAFQETTMAGLPMLLTAVLLHAAPSCTPSEARPEALPDNFAEAALSVVRVLNNVARLDLLALQSGLCSLCVGASHLLGFLVSYATNLWPSHLTDAIVQQALHLGEGSLWHQLSSQPARTCTDTRAEPHKSTAAPSCDTSEEAEEAKQCGGMAVSSEASSSLQVSSAAETVALLNEVLLLLGYFCLLDTNNQGLLTWGRPPDSVLQRLMTIPAAYKDHAVLSQVLVPSLAAVCFNNSRTCEPTASWLDPGQLAHMLQSMRPCDSHVVLPKGRHKKRCATVGAAADRAVAAAEAISEAPSQQTPLKSDEGSSILRSCQRSDAADGPKQYRCETEPEGSSGLTVPCHAAPMHQLPQRYHVSQRVPLDTLHEAVSYFLNRVQPCVKKTSSP